MQISDLIPWGRDKNEIPASRDGRENNPLAELQREIIHVFEDFWQRGESGLNGRTNDVGMFGPRTDVSETDDNFEMIVELPGLSEKDIDISLSGETMTIRVEKKVEHEEERNGVCMSERSYGTFHRAIPLPPSVDTDKAEAKFKGGVLIVTLPKSAKARAKVKRISVKAV